MKHYKLRMKKNLKTIAVCLAGGSGTRMGTDTPKVLLPINNIPAVIYSLKAFDSSEFIDETVLVCPEGQIEKYQSLLLKYNISKTAMVIKGGAERSESVYNALCAIEGSCAYVMIHDGARPMINKNHIKILFDKCVQNKSAIAARPVVNTLKKVNSSKIEDTVDRESLWEVYTPQCFEYSLIKKGYDYVIKNNIKITDDAGALEAIDIPVYIADIGNRDFKLTTLEDIGLVEKLLMNNDEIRVGIGYDVHRFAQNRKLVLGGVEILFSKGLLGHSDADVATHAVMDALLGAAGLPDIGHLFPDSSEEFKGIYSITLLEKVYEKITELGFYVNNIDMVIACEEPKISPYRNDMVKCLADAMKCEIGRINIKATTTEKLGFEGRGEGISARCIASLVKHSKGYI